MDYAYGIKQIGCRCRQFLNLSIQLERLDDDSECPAVLVTSGEPVEQLIGYS